MVKITSFAEITASTNRDDIIDFLASSCNGASPERVLAQFRKIKDPKVAEEVLTIAIGCGTSVKKVIGPMVRTMGTKLPASFTVNDDINMTALAMLCHLVMLIKVEYMSGPLARMKQGYKQTIGGAEDITMFVSLPGDSNKTERNKILGKWKERIQGVDRAEVLRVFQETVPRHVKGGYTGFRLVSFVGSVFSLPFAVLRAFLSALTTAISKVYYVIFLVQASVAFFSHKMRVIALLTLSFSSQLASFSWQSVRRSCVTSLTRTSAHFRSNKLCSSRTSSSLLFGKAKSQNEEKVSNEEDDSRQTKLNNNQILLQELDNKFSYDGRMRQHQQMETAHPQNDSRFGYVGLVGAPNMGKSTLLNALIREDLCVASRRPQTTRHAILGILSEENVQLAFTDTPGVIENPSYMLQEGMMEAVKGALNEADVILLVTDVFSTPIPDDTLFNKIQHLSSTGAKPVIVAVNKVDMLEKFLEKRRKWEQQKQNQVQVIGDLENNPTESTSIAEFEEDANDEFVDQDENMKTFSIEDAVWRWRTLLPNAVAIIPVIATDKNNVGVDCLRTLLCGVADVPEAIRNLGRPIPGMFQEGVKFISNQDARSLIPLGPPLYDQDTLTDRTERFFASEMIRAAIFEEFKKEIPYCTEVQITEFKESKPEDGNKSSNSKLSSIIRMSATIFVERESQKGIVVGTGGNQIKKVGIRARKSLETFFQSKVYLELRVKVEKDWRSKEDRLKKFGYIN